MWCVMLLKWPHNNPSEAFCFLFRNKYFQKENKSCKCISVALSTGISSISLSFLYKLPPKYLWNEQILQIHLELPRQTWVDTILTVVSYLCACKSKLHLCLQRFLLICESAKPFPYSSPCMAEPYIHGFSSPWCTCMHMYIYMCTYIHIYTHIV